MIINLFKSIFKYIFLVILAIIIALGSIFAFAFIHSYLSTYRYADYLFYLVPNSSFILGVGIILFWCFFLFNKIIYKINMKKLETESSLYDSSYEDEALHIENKYLQVTFKLLQLFDNFKFKKIIMIILIILSSAGLFYSYSTFNVITKNQIIIHNPFNLSGKTYSFSDVVEINTGISDDKDNNLYYKLKLKDGTIVNVTAASMDSKYKKYELGIYYLDQKLLKKGINKNIDTQYINKFENKRYNENYVKNVKKILE